MAMRSEHYAMDVPRYTKVIAPAEVGGRPLGGAVIERVEFKGDIAAPVSVVLLHLTDGGEPVPVHPHLRLTVEPTPERGRRLAEASALLSGASRLPCGCPLDSGCNGYHAL